MGPKIVFFLSLSIFFLKKKNIQKVATDHSYLLSRHHNCFFLLIYEDDEFYKNNNIQPQAYWWKKSYNP